MGGEEEGNSEEADSPQTSHSRPQINCENVMKHIKSPSTPTSGFENLPLEFLDLIASHLETRSLALSSLLCKIFRAISSPKLFKHLPLEERLEEGRLRTLETTSPATFDRRAV